MGALNLVVAFNFDTATWVNFKLFGTLALTVLFVIGQGVYLSRHLKEGADVEAG
jgi:intracellular septation protein